MRSFLLLLLLAAPFPSSGGGPAMDILPLADSALAQERRFYWMKCSRALESRREARGFALRGVALFLANVPLEYAASRYRFREKREPMVLNGAAFVLMGTALLHLSLSFRRYEEYEAGRACCRYWQDYASVPTPPGFNFRQ